MLSSLTVVRISRRGKLLGETLRSHRAKFLDGEYRKLDRYFEPASELYRLLRENSRRSSHATRFSIVCLRRVHTAAPPPIGRRRPRRRSTPAAALCTPCARRLALAENPISPVPARG